MLVYQIVMLCKIFDTCIKYGWGFEHPDLLEDIPARDRGLELDDP